MLKKSLKKSLQTFSTLGYLLLPGICILCQDPSKRALDLCRACEQDLPILSNGCQQCAMPLETHSTSLTCGQCLKSPPAFDRMFTLFPYQMPIARLINDLKFQQRLVNAKVLGTLFARQLQGKYQTITLPELIIPVPLHKVRLKERGYNQALELARPISHMLRLPIDYQLCQRIRHTQHQTKIDAQERHKNLRGAFCAINTAPKHIVIVDDVVTTGSTINELARCLRTAGAEHIDVWSVTRTILGSH